MQLVNIGKIYKSKKGLECTALHDVNIHFPDKGLVFVLGKSGCGKSTLLNILGGLDSPTSGIVTNAATCLSKLSSNEINNYRYNNIGFVFQDYNLIDSITVKENVLIGCFNDRNSEKKMMEYMSKLDVVECLNKMPSELSGGQQQRIAIARSLMKNCKILLADEPTGNLDTANTQIVYELLKEISKDILVIVVSHDRELVELYSDEYVILDDGKVVESTINEKNSKDIDIDVSTKKQKIKAKTLSNLSWSLIAKKKLRVVLSLIMLVISLGTMGLCVMCYQYDFNKISSELIMRYDDNILTIGHGNIDNKTGDYVRSMRPISQNSIDTFYHENPGLESIGITYAVPGLYINNVNTGNSILSNTLQRITITQEKYIDNYGMNVMMGTFPRSGNEVAITDFVAYSIIIQKPQLVFDIIGNGVFDLTNDELLAHALLQLPDETQILLFGENWYKERLAESLLKIRNNYGLLLLNQQLDFVSGKVKVQALLDTGFDKYKDIIYMNEEEFSNDERYEELINKLSLYYSNIYASEDIFDNIFKERVVMGNCEVAKLSNYTEVAPEITSLKYNEVIMSRNFFREFFKEEFDKGKIDSYLFNDTISLPYGVNGAVDTIYAGTNLKVIGVFDMPNNVFYRDKAYLTSDEYFNNYSKNIYYAVELSSSKPTNPITLNKCLEYMETNEMHYKSSFAPYAYELTRIMKLFKSIFLIVASLLSVFAIMFMVNYFSATVIDQKKEIGIMRSIGYNSTRLSYIFLLAGLILSCVAIIASTLLTYLLGLIANSILVEKYILFANTKLLNGMKIISFNYLPFVMLSIFAILITAVSILLPLIRIKKMQPIDAIRKN